MNCEKLTPNALKIFEQIKAYYPPEPWRFSPHTEEGIVWDNGWHDLKLKDHRERLIKRYEHLIGSTIVMFAGSQKDKTGKFTRVAFNFKLSKKWIEQTILLRELDFQIETMDLVEG